MTYSDPYGLCPPQDKNLLDCPIIRNAVAATTEAGETATAAWADQSVNGSTALSRGTATIMGHFAALWTPDTHEATARTLVGAWDFRNRADDSTPNPADLSLLSSGEIRKLQAGGVDPHDLKPRHQGSRYDLYKARETGDGYQRGDIFYMRKPQYGQGDPVPTGHNINEY